MSNYKHLTFEIQIKTCSLIELWGHLFMKVLQTGFHIMPERNNNKLNGLYKLQY